MDSVFASQVGRTSRTPQRLVALLIVLAALVPFAAGAGEPAPFPLPITKFNCETDPGVIGQAELPDGCVLVEGVSMTVTDGDDNDLGSCITDANGTCTVDVDVPDDATVFVTEDESTGTDGYSPRENPVEVEITNEFSEAKLVNIKDETKLPNTGAGSLGNDTQPLPLALATIAILLALAATATRTGIDRIR